MGPGREAAGGRMRWIVVFAALLLACSAAPVLADSPGAASEEPASQASDGDDPERYFDGHVVVPDLAEAEREEREREEWLASPEAVKQREASWSASVTYRRRNPKNCCAPSSPNNWKR